MKLINIFSLFFYQIILHDLCSLASSSLSEKRKHLDRIIVVVRHGDRAPLFPFAFDRDRMNELWPNGYGYLTSEGRTRMYRIGQFLRRRYSYQFPGRYISPRDVYIRSSTIPRCLESSQLIAAGLSPPIGVWQWKSDIGELWQPVPIFTVQRWREALLNPSSNCELAFRLFERIRNSPVVKNYLLLHQEIIQNISCITHENLRDHREIREFVDNLVSSKHHGRRLPKWCTANVYNQLKEIFDISLRFDYTGEIEPELRRLRAGVLMNEIFKGLDPDIDPYRSRLSIYVTHDSQLLHLRDALGLDMNSVSLMFGSMLMFEYNKQEDSVHLYSANVPGPMDRITAEELKIPVCEKNLTRIPLGYLQTKYKHLFLDLDEFDRQCGNSNDGKQPMDPYL